MAKRTLLFLAIVGSTLLWSALIAEISLRYVTDSFLVLFLLVALAVVSTSYGTYKITIRNQHSQPHTQEATKRRQTQRQSGGMKKTSERAPKTKTSRNPANKSTSSRASVERANNRSKTVSQSDSSSVVTTSGKRIKGRVRVYYIRRSYGFVEDDSKQTVFFHKSAIGPEIDERDLTKKPEVSYVVTSSDRGPIATEIQLEQ